MVRRNWSWHAMAALLLSLSISFYVSLYTKNLKISLREGKPGKNCERKKASDYWWKILTVGFCFNFTVSRRCCVVCFCSCCRCFQRVQSKSNLLNPLALKVLLLTLTSKTLTLPCKQGREKRLGVKNVEEPLVLIIKPHPRVLQYHRWPCAFILKYGWLAIPRMSSSFPRLCSSLHMHSQMTEMQSDPPLPISLQKVRFHFQCSKFESLSIFSVS